CGCAPDLLGHVLRIRVGGGIHLPRRGGAVLVARARGTDEWRPRPVGRPTVRDRKHRALRDAREVLRISAPDDLRCRDLDRRGSCRGIGLGSKYETPAVQSGRKHWQGSSGEFGAISSILSHVLVSTCEARVALSDE